MTTMTWAADPAADPAQPVRCHPNAELRGGAPGCPYIQPCTQRCHIRWLDGDDQLSDNLTRLTDHPRGPAASTVEVCHG